jgi:hypothetical protein
MIFSLFSDGSNVYATIPNSKKLAIKVIHCSDLTLNLNIAPFEMLASVLLLKDGKCVFPNIRLSELLLVAI